MIDLKFLRENPDVIKNDLEKRKDEQKLPWVDDILEQDKMYRELLQESQELRSRRNKVSELINQKKKNKENADAEIQEAKDLPVKLEKIEEKIEAILDGIKMKLMRLPNILHESVPYGATEEENKEIEKINPKPEFSFKPKDHETLAKKHDLIDLERAAKITGARWAFIKGDLALLDRALQQYAIDFMTQRGFELLIPPFAMNKKAYEGVTDLDDFENVMYNLQPDDFYLIATSEHPLTAMHMNESFEETELPKRMVGISQNFRREAGSHHKSDKGIWRMHQFTKIEQVVLCKPEESWQIYDELLTNAKDFFESLGLHFRVIDICTGDMGIVAAKKNDLEAWIPSADKYKEIVSCSNVTAYQATRLNMKVKRHDGKEFLHTLNSTCVATSRALVAIIEQFQTQDGNIRIPKPLQKYMNKSLIGHV